jgi:hypothetical protein
MFVINDQEFSDGMKTMQDIGVDAVYVNMTGQNPSCPNFLETKGGFLCDKSPCRKNILLDLSY